MWANTEWCEEDSSEGFLANDWEYHLVNINKKHNKIIFGFMAYQLLMVI